MKTISIVIGMLAIGAAACGGEEPEPTTQEANILWSDIIGAVPRGEQAKYPFILQHGFAASPRLNGFFEVDDALMDDRHVVYVSEAPPFKSAWSRSEALAGAVERALADGHEKVNIIAHSMGGLDARALISQRGYGDVVATLLTVSTPHHGSRIADVALQLLDLADEDGLERINDFVDLIGSSFSDMSENGDVVAALVDLSEANAPVFNDANPNDDRVYYATIAGVSNGFGIAYDGDLDACDGKHFNYESGAPAYPGKGGVADILSPALALIAPVVGWRGDTWLPNDGLVTIESAQLSGSDWLGCLPADHADEIGQLRHKRADWLTGFDHRRLYRNWAFELAARGY